jgi:alpha/beta superfamily hydrolase
LYGGSLSNKVVTSLAKGFLLANFRVVRFNFRGVGQSEGAYDGGDGEQADLLAVHAFARAQWPQEKVRLAGFSFGAYVALRAHPGMELEDLMVVAPPVDLYDFSRVPAPQAPWSLILAGDDEVVCTQAILDWHADLPVKAHVYWRRGASHFFHGQLIWLRKIAQMLGELAPQ